MHIAKTILGLQEVSIKNPNLKGFIHVHLFMPCEISGNIFMRLN